MNRKEFFEKLAEVKDKFVWSNEEKAIRGKLKHHNQNTPDCTFCPIECIAYSILKRKSDYEPYRLDYCVAWLQLKPALYESIIRAADYLGAKHTRRELKKVLGI